jgi:hypothetical protein
MNKNVKGVIIAVVVSAIIGVVLYVMLDTKPKSLYLPVSKLEKFKDLNATTISVGISSLVLVIMLAQVYAKRNK